MSNSSMTQPKLGASMTDSLMMVSRVLTPTPPVSIFTLGWHSDFEFMLLTSIHALEENYDLGLKLLGCPRRKQRILGSKKKSHGPKTPETVFEWSENSWIEPWVQIVLFVWFQCIALSVSGSLRNMWNNLGCNFFCCISNEWVMIYNFALS